MSVVRGSRFQVPPDYLVDASAGARRSASSWSSGSRTGTAGPSSGRSRPSSPARSRRTATRRSRSMELLGASKDAGKVAMGWIVGEVRAAPAQRRASRAAPPSSLLELRGRSAGIEGKPSPRVELARQAVRGRAQRISRERLGDLVDRAEAQRGGGSRRTPRGRATGSSIASDRYPAAQQQRARGVLVAHAHPAALEVAPRHHRLARVLAPRCST